MRRITPNLLFCSLTVAARGGGRAGIAGDIIPVAVVSLFVLVSFLNLNRKRYGCVCVHLCMLLAMGIGPGRAH